MNRKLIVWIIVVMPVLMGITLLIKGWSVKMINDITTTIPAVQFETLSKSNLDRNYRYPNDFYETQKVKYPEIKPLAVEGEPSVVFEKAKKIISTLGWNVVDADEKNFKIEATATTKFLRFKDDIAIEIREKNSLTEVHMRSKSRLGKDDFGANARRILSFFHKLETSE